MKQLALSLVLLVSAPAAMAEFNLNDVVNGFNTNFPEQTGCAVVGRELAGQVAQKVAKKQAVVTVKGINVVTVEDLAQVAVDVTTEGVKRYKQNALDSKALAERAAKTYLREKGTQLVIAAGQEAAERAGLQLPSFLDPKLVSLFVKNIVRHGLEQIISNVRQNTSTPQPKTPSSN